MALAQLCRALLTRALVLSPAELAEYEEDPEGFVHEESVARETEGLRKCAERCLQTLADTSECRQQVQQAVLGLCAETAAAGLEGLPAVLALDACYLAACPGRTLLLDGSVRAVHLPTSRKGKADRSGVFVRRKQIRAIRAHYARHNRTCWESNGLKGHGVTARNGTQVACLGQDNSHVVRAMEARMKEWRG